MCCALGSASRMRWMIRNAAQRTQFLRLDLLQPLDVVLSGGKEFQQVIIRAGTGFGQFSHASLVIQSCLWFESDEYGVLPTLKAPTFVGRCGSEPIYLLEAPNHWQVLRHPDLGNLDEDKDVELKQRFGALWRELQLHQYPPLEQLADAAHFQTKGKAVIRRLLRVLDLIRWQLEMSDRPVIAGHFCAELVAEVFARLDIKLFADDRPAIRVSPNALAKMSLLRPMQVIGGLPQGFRKDRELYAALFEGTKWDSLDRRTTANLIRRKASILLARQKLSMAAGKMDHLVEMLTLTEPESAAELKMASDELKNALTRPIGEIASSPYFCRRSDNQAAEG